MLKKKEFIFTIQLKNMNTENVVNLRLEGIAAGGEALGHFNGKTVFVEGGAPEETVCCRIIEERNTWARAQLLEIIEASPVRVAAKCAFYSKCGGCNLQHISYDSQLAIKSDILKDTILRFGSFSPPEIETVSSPQFEYRNRMQFHCFREQGKIDSPKFGLKGRKSGEIVAVSDCPIAVPGIRELLCSGGKSLPLPPEKDRFNIFSHNELLLSEGAQEKGKITIGGKEIFLYAGVFFQSNIVILEKLIFDLRKIAESAAMNNANKNLPMADLYCGVGTFAIFLGDLFPKIIAAEENKKAVSIARENLKGSNIEFFALRDLEWEKAFLRRKEGYGFMVVDPPRAGLAPKLAELLAREGAAVLAYVSCNAASLARDAKILTNGGYKLKELKLFDFYPHTAHIETLAVFYK